MPKGFIIYAIPNGEKRDIGTARKLKAEGVLAGMPDLHIPEPKKGYSSLYIEVKTSKGRVSPVQKEMHKTLRSKNNLVMVCRSWKDICYEVAVYYFSDSLELDNFLNGLFLVK